MRDEFLQLSRRKVRKCRGPLSGTPHLCDVAGIDELKKFRGRNLARIVRRTELSCVDSSRARLRNRREFLSDNPWSRAVEAISKRKKKKRGKRQIRFAAFYQPESLSTVISRDYSERTKRSCAVAASLLFFLSPLLIIMLESET